jgi:hypothetical protein
MSDSSERIHPAKGVTAGDQSALIDLEIVPLILEIWARRTTKPRPARRPRAGLPRAPPYSPWSPRRAGRAAGGEAAKTDG